MNIANLTVENFKCYKTATTAEFAPITLIYGENGGGKSTLLQALDVLKKTAPKDSNADRNSLREKHAQRNNSEDLMIRFEDGSAMNWELTSSTSEVAAGPGGCDFIETLFNSLFDIIQRDFPALKCAILEHLDNNIKVISLTNALNREINSSSTVRQKYEEIISSQYKVYQEEHGAGWGLNIDLEKAFSEDTDIHVYGKGAISSFIEQQRVKIDDRDAASLNSYENDLKSFDSLKSELLKVSGYNNSLNRLDAEKALNKFLNIVSTMYTLTSKLKVNIWADGEYDRIYYGFNYLSKMNNSLFSENSMFRYIFGKFSPRYLTFNLIKSKLTIFFENHRNAQTEAYFSGLNFVDQPRGYSGMLSNPINAKLKRNLAPLLHQMFPEISFDIRTEGEKKDIYIYDDVLDAEVPATECGFGYSQILPVLIALADTDNEVVCISEPESHIHPRLQAGIGSLFLDVFRRSGKQIIAETHSEHIVLRIQRLIRCGEMKPEEVSVLYVSKTPEGSTIKRLHLDEKGRFIDAWPQGFFAERDEELFGGKPA